MAYTPQELVTVLTSREMTGTRTVFAGVGLPLVAALAAKKTHCPDLIIVVEGGSIDSQPVPGRLPISTNEMRIAYRAQMLAEITDVFLLAQRGFLDLGIMGGAQIDRFGNVNTTAIGAYGAPDVRLPGSGGANDIASLCRRTILVTMHERRRFVPKVDFVTSPGYLAGGRARREAGLIFGRVDRVVTDLGIFTFDEETKEMQVMSLHPGVSPDDLRDRTGFELRVAGRIRTTEPPTAAELDAVRGAAVDRRYLRA